MFSNSFSKKVVVGAMVLTSLLIAMVVAAIFYQQRTYVYQLVDESLSVSAKELSSGLSVHLKVHNVHGLQRLLGDSYLVRESVFMFVSNVNGETVYAYPDPDKPYLASTCEFRFNTVPVYFGEERIGALSYCFDPERLVHKASSSFLLIPLLIGMLLWSASLIIWLRYQTSRIHRFVRAIEAINPEDPYLPQVPEQDRSDTTIATLYAKVGQLIGKLVITSKELREREKEALFTELSRQVAHDIRSPLSALSLVVKSVDSLPEEKRLLIRNATQRINDIANNLLQKSKGIHTSEFKTAENEPASLQEPILLMSLIDAIVSEKRAQYREQLEVDIQVDFERGYGLFALIESSELARAISNLVNNSVEAVSGSGRVCVQLEEMGSESVIKIIDNGNGIPPEIISRIGQRGLTHGKGLSQSGSGLGVFHAMKIVEKANGTFKIESEIGCGTTVKITLPKSNPPWWFVSKLDLYPHMTVVSVDDDQTIHQIWSGRLASAGAFDMGIQHLKFSSLEQLESWASGCALSQTLFLVDYEFLGQFSNGLDTIERMGFKDRAILVTSRYEESQVRARAERLCIRILPKTLAPFVPLAIEKPYEKYDAVLIDDDPLVRMTWQMAAQERGRKLLCFADPEEFWQQAQGIHSDSSFYIDVSLGAGVRGEDVAKKLLVHGFADIHLVTGYASETLAIPRGVRSVRGKAPAF